MSVSVSVHESTIEAVRGPFTKAPSRPCAPGSANVVSGYVEAAMQRQIERDGLAELIAANEEIHGPLTDEEIRAAGEKMFGGSTEAAA